MTRTMKVAVVPQAGAAIEIAEREIPRAGAGQVVVKVQACGICHSDSLTVDGTWPGIEYPRVPGHEIAGVVEEIGEGVVGWEAGQRVGVGWYGGHCGHCDRCRRGDLVLCENGMVPGVSYDGGYAEYVLVPAQTLARIPESLNDVDAAPLLCAGITTFNALRNSGVRPGEVVAVLGLGGLGHLAVQYAAKLGFETVAIARGQEKGDYARELGAHHYIDSTAENVAERLMALGGAKIVLATVTSGKAMSDAFGGLAVDGKMMVLGIADSPIEINSAQAIMGRRSVQGWPSGVAADSEDTLAFSARSGVRPQIEVYPLEKAAEAYERMLSGKARFRVVLQP